MGILEELESEEEEGKRIEREDFLRLKKKKQSKGRRHRKSEAENWKSNMAEWNGRVILEEWRWRIGYGYLFKGGL